MVINNPDNLRFSVNLVELLCVNPSLAQITTIKRLNSLTTYFIHCDLVDKDQNLLNGKASTVKQKPRIKSSINLIAKTNTPSGSMVINNPDNLRFSVNLVELLCVNPSLAQITTIKRLNSPTTYFIHCDLVDKDQNLLNGKASTVLARFDIRGTSFEKVITKQHPKMSCVMHRLVIMQK